MGLVQLRVGSYPMKALCSSHVQVCSSSSGNSVSFSVRFSSELPDVNTPQQGSSSEPAITR